MSSLPFLVQHGAAVWQACLALLVVASIALARRRPRLAARRAARLARAGLAPAVDLGSAPKGARVTLAGTIDFSGDAPALHTAGQAVRLEGDITILAGSREDWPRGAATRRRLATGDRVLVCGVLGDEADEEARTYREAARRVMLGGGLVAAFEGVPRVHGPAPVALVRPAAGGALLFLAIFGVGGEIAYGEARRGLIEYQVFSADEQPFEAALAAATPFRREQTLARILETLDAREDPDPHLLAARAALHEVRGERATAASLWIAHGEPERGAELAKKAGDTVLAARGWYAAGAFDRASDACDAPESWAAQDQRFCVGVHLLAGRLDRAESATRRLAWSLASEPSRSPELTLWNAGRVATVNCLTTALAARNASPPKRPSIVEWHEGSTIGCVVLGLDVLEGAQRAAAIDSLPTGRMAATAYDVPLDWIDLLDAEAAPTTTHASFPLAFDSAARALAIPNGGALAKALPAVERRVATAASDRAITWPFRATLPMEADVAASAAVFAYLAGERGVARKLAKWADRADADLDGDPFGRTVDAEGAVALPDDPEAANAALSPPVYIDEIGRPWKRRFLQEIAARKGFLRGLRDYVVEHDTSEMLRALVAEPPPNEDEEQAWWLAAGGDGVALAAWLRSPRAQPGTFLRYGAPLLKTGRVAVANWIRWGHRPVAGFHPIDELVHLVTLADAAEALGDTNTAEEMRRRASKFREAILRRETAVPLAVLERL